MKSLIFLLLLPLLVAPLECNSASSFVDEDETVEAGLPPWLLFLVSQDGAVDPVDPEPTVCGENGKKEFVKSIIEEWYLWYQELATVSSDDFQTAQEYLDALTSPLATDGRDPGFSYLTTQAQDEANASAGAYIGFGFNYTCNDAACFFFSDVLQGGPAADAGFSRGDEVLAIDVGNGYETIQQLVDRNISAEELLGPAEVGVSRGFRVQTTAGEIVESVLEKRELVMPPLAVEPLLIAREGLGPIGYLNLRSFSYAATEELGAATSYFRENNASDLIIDLRYNGGGLLNVADMLLDLLGGAVAEGQRSIWLKHNNKHAQQDVYVNFTPRPETINPLRIAFITSQSTAAASEIVINGLAPHLEVVLVGEDTLGKAVGQYAFDQSQSEGNEECDTRLRLVSFELVNGEGEGGYYQGLANSGRFLLCPALDDVTYGFGDPREASFAAAATWLSQGVCPAPDERKILGGGDLFRSHSELSGPYR